MLVIGASREAVREARAAVNDILKAECYEETKRVALTTLASICEIKNTNISNNTFANK